VLKRLAKFDRRLLRTMRTRLHQPAVERAAKALAMAGEWGSVWVAIGLAGAAVDAPRRERWLRAAAVAPAAIGVNYLVKLSVRRRRPRLRRLPPLGRAPSQLSFPSAHATSSVAAAVALGRVAPGARLPHYGLAGAICLTRPYLGMHYPSDVLGGAVIGALLGGLWPGLRGKGTEDRLIDLVASAARSTVTASADDSGANGGARVADRQPSTQPPFGEGEPGSS
jgi:decaprenylphosphoryl-5-phosphoribose phosphatase